MSKKPKDKLEKTTLSDEEHQLWQRVADSVTPFNPSNRDNDRVRVSGTDTTMPEEPVTARPSEGSSKPVENKHVRRGTHSSATQQRPANAPEPKGLGQANVRRLRSGRINIEARLDLHGMRQGEAHGALRHFLFASQQRGLRWVMVITGKGGRTSRPDSDVDHFDGFGRHAEPGVLRRNVPRWLQEPDLRALVIGFQTAGPQHGGDGALYIHLRRRDRVKS